MDDTYMNTSLYTTFLVWFIANLDVIEVDFSIKIFKDSFCLTRERATYNCPRLRIDFGR